MSTQAHSIAKLRTYLLAMTHWQLGHTDEAREWYDRAVDWMEKEMPNDEELRRFRSEAAELLGVEIGDKNQTRKK